MKIFKQIFSIILRIGVSIIVLIFLFKQMDKRTLLEIISHANIGLLVLAFIVFFLNYLLGVWRWQLLLKAVKIHLPLKRIIISYSGGVFFSLFLPSTIGGDLMRSIDLATHTKRPGEVVATVLLDRLSGYVGLTILALISLGFGWKLVQDKSVLACVLIITLILIAVLLALFNKFIYSKINKLLHSPDAGKIRELIKDLHNEIHFFRHREKVIVYNIILSVLIQIIAPLTFFITALALGVKISIVYYFIFLPIIGAITLLPISIGGLGLREATTIYFFAKAGVCRNASFAMSLINFSFILIFGALGGLIYVFTVHHRRIQHHQAPAVRAER